MHHEGHAYGHVAFTLVVNEPLDRSMIIREGHLRQSKRHRKQAWEGTGRYTGGRTDLCDDDIILKDGATECARGSAAAFVDIDLVAATRRASCRHGCVC